MTGKSGIAPKNEACENFKSWFVDILKRLYPIREAGLAILLITFPMLERYLRQRAKLTPKENLTPECMDGLISLMPEYLKTRKDAWNFWNVYRNALLHTLTFSPEDKKGFPLPGGIASHDISEVLTKLDKDWCLHPVLFAQRVVSAIGADFRTFQGDPKGKFSFPKIVILDAGTLGTGGFGHKTSNIYHGTH